MIVVPLLLAALQQPAAPAQTPPPVRVPQSVGDTSPFRRLELPAPNLIREGSGMPGPRYWQQRADYTKGRLRHSTSRQAQYTVTVGPSLR